MIQLPEEFDSIFRYIVVVSQRAEQLINGAKVRTESRYAKPTLKARDDVDGKAVDWRVLTQEELDAHREAMVEQFRAEVSAVTEPESSGPIPDVLPTGDAAPVAEGGDEERDDELARLQRLLGMTGQVAKVVEETEDSDEAKDPDAVKGEAPVEPDPEDKKKKG